MALQSSVLRPGMRLFRLKLIEIYTYHYELNLLGGGALNLSQPFPQAVNVQLLKWIAHISRFEE